MKNLLITAAIVLGTIFMVGIATMIYAADYTQTAVDSLVNNDADSPGANMVWTSSSTGYVFYLDFAGGISMASTTDGGTTWSEARNVDSVNTLDAVISAVWWDGWTAGRGGQYIHICTLDTGVDDTYYTRLDLSTGQFSTTVLATTQGATATRGTNYVAITEAENGALYMAAADTSDSWVVKCTTTCTTAGNWSEAASGFDAAGDDVPMLMPIGGTNNVLLVYDDISADTIAYDVYSATSSSFWWTGTNPTVATTIEDNTTYEGAALGMTHASTTGLSYITFLDDDNDFATQDHDIRVFKYSSTTWSWTGLTNPITDASGGLIAAKLAIEASSSRMFSIYGRRTTIGTAGTGNVYYRTSTDGGSTWGNEIGPLNTSAGDYHGIHVVPISWSKLALTYFISTQALYSYVYWVASSTASGPPETPAATITGSMIIFE